MRQRMLSGVSKVAVFGHAVEWIAAASATYGREEGGNRISKSVLIRQDGAGVRRSQPRSETRRVPATNGAISGIHARHGSEAILATGADFATFAKAYSL